MALTKADLEMLPCQPEMEVSTSLLPLKCAYSLISVAGRRKEHMETHFIIQWQQTQSRFQGVCRLSSEQLRL